MRFISVSFDFRLSCLYAALLRHKRIVVESMEQMGRGVKDVLDIEIGARGDTLACDTSTDIAIVEVGIPCKHGCNLIPGLPKSS